MRDCSAVQDAGVSHKAAHNARSRNDIDAAFGKHWIGRGIQPVAAASSPASSLWPPLSLPAVSTALDPDTGGAVPPPAAAASASWAGGGPRETPRRGRPSRRPPAESALAPAVTAPASSPDGDPWDTMLPAAAAADAGAVAAADAAKAAAIPPEPDDRPTPPTPPRVRRCATAASNAAASARLVTPTAR